MIAHEVVPKKSLWPKAVFVYGLGAAEHLIKHAPFQILASAASRDRRDS
jgi:hypothetical protein